MKKIFFIFAICGVLFINCGHNHNSNDNGGDISTEHHHDHEETCEGGHDHDHNHENSAENFDPSKNPFAVKFSKLMQEKVDFELSFPEYGDFGQVIKTVAKVETAIGDETTIIAKTNGTINFAVDNLTSGSSVNSGQSLFSISGEGFVDNNARYEEAKNNFIKAQADYDKAQELATSKIISEKELREIKNNYLNAKTIYDNYKSNFSSGARTIFATMTGFVKQIYVLPGQYVEAGTSLLTITKNKNLFLTANVSPKYISYLQNIKTANIKTNSSYLHDESGKHSRTESYSLEELDGKLISYGKSTNEDKFLIPVTFQIANRDNFVAGTLVDIYIITTDKHKVISVPNTAIIEEMGNYFVYVQLAPEYFEKRQVTIECTDGKRTEISSGLKKTEKIVSRGAILLKLSSSGGALDPHAGHAH